MEKAGEGTRQWEKALVPVALVLRRFSEGRKRLEKVGESSNCLLRFTTFLLKSTQIHFFVPFCTVSRGSRPPPGFPGSPGVSSKKVRESSKRFDKVGGGRRRSEEVGEGRRRLEKAGEGRRKLEKVG